MVDSKPSVGIIGMGEMGKMYAKYMSDSGRRRCVTSTGLMALS
jgi:prephenate dehydrogenase